MVIHHSVSFAVSLCVFFTCERLGDLFQLDLFSPLFLLCLALFVCGRTLPGAAAQTGSLRAGFDENTWKKEDFSPALKH